MQVGNQSQHKTCTALRKNRLRRYNENMGYTKNAIAGFSWQTILKLATSIMTLVKISVLARLLSPTDFGLFSLTAVALGITESLTQTGINLTIIQAKESIRYFIDTAWVIAIIRGLLIGVVMVMLGWGISRWYQEPSLVLLIGVSALVPIIKGFINPAIITLHKEMRFFHDSLYRFSLSFIEAFLAIVAGFFLHSVWALVIALLGAALFEVFISFWFFTDRPHFRYYPSRAQMIIRNGKWLGLATILNYLNENADNVILGKIIGTHSLGLYQNSYALAHKVNYEVAKSIHHGVIPIYAKIHTQPQRLNPAFMKALATTAGLAIIGSLPLLIFPELVVKIILGSQWLAAIPYVPWLALAGILQAISAASYSLFLAKRHYHFLNNHLWCTLLLTLGLITWWGTWQGLGGAVIGILVARITTTPLLAYFICQSLEKPALELRERS